MVPGGRFSWDRGLWLAGAEGIVTLNSTISIQFIFHAVVLIVVGIT